MTSDSGLDAESGITPEEQPAAEVAGRRVLRRSKSNRVIAGVAGGLGHYLGVDPILLRIAFVVLFLTGWGWAVLLYVIAWIAIREEAPGEAISEPVKATTAQGRLIIGGLLILFGLVLLLDRYLDDFYRYAWPAAVMLAGLAILFGGRR